MGGERIGRPGSSVLGREVWDCPIDVERPQPFRSVIDYPQAPWTDSPPVLVDSTDLSPAGSLLATGSADRQVRICKSHYSPEFSLALVC